MTHTITHTITRDGTEIELDIEYAVADYFPARGPSWDSPGDPAEGGEIETLEATLDGKPFTLTAEEQEAIEVWIYENHDYSEEPDYYD